jgi:hypothetical protein
MTDKGRYDWEEGDIVLEDTPKQSRAWDEGAHPREPPGGPGGGQFAGGGSSEGGGADTKPAAGGKKPAKREDFANDRIPIAGNKDKLIERWNERIGYTPAEFRTKFLGGVDATMTIKFDEDEDRMIIDGKLLDGEGKPIGDYTREIDFDDNMAASVYFVLDKKATGSDVGKKILAANVKMYQEIGIETVEVHANVDVGGYAWARYGYVPSTRSWREDLQPYLNRRLSELSTNVIVEVEGEEQDNEPQFFDEVDHANISVDEREELQELIDSRDSKAIWAIADHKHGKALLLDSDWEGELDFNDDETMERFNAYITKKKASA